MDISGCRRQGQAGALWRVDNSGVRRGGQDRVEVNIQRAMRVRRLAADLVVLALLWGAAAARAEEPVYGPDGAPTVVQRKLHPMSGKWEVGALFDVAINTALVDQLGGVVGICYHPNEWLDAGVEGLFHSTALSGLAVNVRNALPARIAPPQGCSARPLPAECKDEFANGDQLRAGGFAVARIAPIYGKFNLASELKVHFQAFLLGGAGVGSFHRESVNLCATGGTSTCTRFQTSDATRFVGEVGGGFRFYLGQHWSLRTELRGYLFSSSYKAANDATSPQSGTPRSYLGVIATFAAGAAWLF